MGVGCACVFVGAWSYLVTTGAPTFLVVEFTVVTIEWTFVKLKLLQLWTRKNWLSKIAPRQNHSLP